MSQEPKKIGQEPKSNVAQDEENSREVSKSDVIVVENPDNTEQTRASSVIHKKTLFFRGVWAHKSNPTDPDKVVISINGEPIMWQRGIECIVPECYLMAAKDAKYNKYTQEPGKGRKVSAKIERFPFTITGKKEGEHIFDEFRKKFIEGTKVTRDAVASHGLNIPIEKAIQQID